MKNLENSNIQIFKFLSPSSSSHSLRSECKLDKFYHPQSNFLRVKNVTSSTGLVKMSANCFPVGIYLILISPFGLYVVLTRLLKWWYLIAMCFFLGANFSDSAIAILEQLSSWAVRQKFVCGMCRGNTQWFLSSGFESVLLREGHVTARCTLIQR